MKQLKTVKIQQTEDFEDWFFNLTKKERLQITARLERITAYGHFGDSKFLGDGLYELRWKNGWRLYFVMIKDTLILLVGGHKNDQEKDIKKARINIGHYSYN
ncbi:type II toxin-antitoxin system RelE/ParE family toxin [Candidatus Dependentiae bacterium]|nr:type II toxin-antitoxin system RelE/ParE family toxin [Candidatus Dependentiae bacterium]